MSQLVLYVAGSTMITQQGIYPSNLLDSALTDLYEVDVSILRNECTDNEAFRWRKSKVGNIKPHLLVPEANMTGPIREFGKGRLPHSGGGG